MKHKQLGYSKEQIYSEFLITRQAYHQHQKASIKRFLHEELIVGEIRKVRKRQPRVGTRKLRVMLKCQGVEVGRDKLFDILRKYKMLIKPRKSYRKTTDSYHRFRKYSNLIKELQVSRPNEVFVSDITYVHTLEGFCYLVLITDLYSRKIVGYDLSRSLAIEGAQRALRMALRGVAGLKKLIHHSDRGIQFCSLGYIDILKEHGVLVSMTEENHVYENAVAERVICTLKNEFMLGETLFSFEIAKKLVAESIKIYNQERLHLSLDYQTPEYRYAT